MFINSGTLVYLVTSLPRHKLQANRQLQNIVSYLWDTAQLNKVMEYKNNSLLTIQSRLSDSQARQRLDRQYKEYLLLKDHLEILGDREVSDAKKFHLYKKNSSSYQLSDKRMAAMPTRSNIRKTRKINADGEFFLDEKTF